MVGEGETSQDCRSCCRRSGGWWWGHTTDWVGMLARVGGSMGLVDEEPKNTIESLAVPPFKTLLLRWVRHKVLIFGLWNFSPQAKMAEFRPFSKISAEIWPKSMFSPNSTLCPSLRWPKFGQVRFSRPKFMYIHTYVVSFFHCQSLRHNWYGASSLRLRFEIDREAWERIFLAFMWGFYFLKKIKIKEDSPRPRIRPAMCVLLYKCQVWGWSWLMFCMDSKFFSLFVLEMETSSGWRRHAPRPPATQQHVTWRQRRNKARGRATALITSESAIGDWSQLRGREHEEQGWSWLLNTRSPN
mgnify:CR=1 FL=1